MKTSENKTPAESRIRSRARVRERGEVFTAEREVKAMCDLVKAETERIDSRFLEPACGDGNFLAEILSRKLAVVRRKYAKSAADYEKNAVLAASSIYGVDIMSDNVLACRERMFGIWDNEYTAVCRREADENARKAVRFIFSRNIVCGNALTLKCVDENGNDTDTPIVFSEWTFVTGNKMQRSDYTFDELLAAEEKDPVQLSMLDDGGKFKKRYVSDYRRIWEEDMGE